MAKVAFLGLGVMGYPMAGHLVSAGHSVTVYNRSGAKAAAWSEQHQGPNQPSPREAAAGQAIVFACVGNDDDLRSVCLGEEGAFAGMDEGALFVDHTTVSPTVTRELAAAAAAQGLRYVDAPISGGQAGAENGISMSSPGVPRRAGRWRTAARPWSPMSSSSASLWTGCARIWASVWTKPGPTA